VYNGIQIDAEVDEDSDILQFPNKEAIRLLFVGSLTEKKGVDVLLKALSLLENTNASCSIVGEGPLFHLLRDQCNRLKIGEKAHFLGRSSNVRSLMRMHDILVLPSRREGLPLVLLEAMGSGLPVIATRVGGVCECVDDGVHGLLVPPEDPEALAKAIARLAADPELRRKMGKNGLERVRSQFSLQAHVASLLAVYSACLREKVGAGSARGQVDCPQP